MRSLLVLSALAALAPLPAHAQPADLAAANALFDDGRQLLSANATAAACTKFQASLALARQLGTQLNLADCYERLDKTASAWLAFGEASALARELADEPRFTYARDRQAALKPRLIRLRITSRDPAATITRDGAPVAPAAFDVEVPVDPGDHVITARRAGYVPWSRTVTLRSPGAVATVDVPPLAAIAAQTVLGPRRPSTGTWVAVSLGATGLALGTYFGLAARSQWHDARRGCDDTGACTDGSVAATDASRRDALRATIAFAGAGAAIATGVILYLRSPRERIQIAPAIGAGAAGVTVMGGF